MKFFHISDLHIGKRLGLYDLLDLQRDVLEKLIEYGKKEKIEAIIIAGDIYDKSVPSAEAMNLFNDFLNSLRELEIPILIISGNHDSRQRLGFARDFIERQKIYISSALPKNENEFLKKVVLKDQFGEVNFYLLPFTRPANVRNLFNGKVEIKSYDEAIKHLIEREEIDYRKRNVLVAHQFFVNGGIEPQRCESEESYISVGGIDSVSIEHIKNFDYCALGHLHKSQKIGYEKIRYSGTLLKYSVSEAKDKKSVVMVEIGEKGEDIKIDFLEIRPKRDVLKIKGKFSEIISNFKESNKEDYVSITLTDEEEIYMPKERLNGLYKNLIEVKVENSKTKAIFENDFDEREDIKPINLFSSFYKELNGKELDKKEKSKFIEILENIEQESEKEE